MLKAFHRQFFFSERTALSYWRFKKAYHCVWTSVRQRSEIWFGGLSGSGQTKFSSRVHDEALQFLVPTQRHSVDPFGIKVAAFQTLQRALCGWLVQVHKGRTRVCRPQYANNTRDTSTGSFRRREAAELLAPSEGYSVVDSVAKPGSWWGFETKAWNFFFSHQRDVCV